MFLQVWHIFAPVDWRALALVCAGGFAGLHAHRKEISCCILERPRKALRLVVMLLVTAAWLSNHTVMQPYVRDSGLYHLTAIRWCAEYPVVPGLGNLHGRLAFNNSFFLYAAMLDVGPFIGKSHQLASGLLMLFAVTGFLHHFLSVISNRGKVSSKRLFNAVAYCA